MDVAETVALVTLGIVVGLVEGAAIGLVVVAIFYRPGTARGPSARMRHGWSSLVLLGSLGFMWVYAFSPSATSGDQSAAFEMRITVVATAAGGTVGGGWLAMRRWRSNKRSASIDQPGEKPSRHGNSPESSRSKRRRWIVFSFRVIDYVLGSLFCWGALIGGATLGGSIRRSSAHWFSGDTRTVAIVGTYITLILAGFLYSQLISGGALRAMNVALGHDWKIGRTAHYALLVPPFLLAMPLAVAAPGLLLGITSHLASLAIGWRFTGARPSTPLGTFLELRKGWQANKQRTALNKTKMITAESGNDLNSSPCESEGTSKSPETITKIIPPTLAPDHHLDDSP
jgi:hypothetical protein